MKVLIFIAFVSSPALCAQEDQENNQRTVFKQALKEHMVECAKQFNFYTSENGYITDGKPPSRNFQCFVSCMYIKLGFMDENGVIKAEQVRDLLKLFVDEAKSTEIMEKCMGEKGDDACATAYKVSRCSREVLKDIIKNQSGED